MIRPRAVGAVLALLAGVLCTTPAVALADPSGSVVSATTQDGQLTVVLSVHNLPAGSTLDPGSVRMSVDGSEVPASISPMSSANNPLPRRVAVLALDSSGSMAGEGIAGARAAAKTFLAEVPADVQVGLVTFSDRAQTLVSPTADRAAVRAAVDRLNASGDTALYDAIALSVADLGSNGDRALVVLSDGADTSSHATEAGAAAAARASGVRVAFVAFGTRGAQTAALNRIAAATGGRVVPAAGTTELATAFSAAARSFDTQVSLRAPVPDSVGSGSHKVAVSLRFGDVIVQGTTDFSVPVAPVAASAHPTTPNPATKAPLALLGLVFLALLALTITVVLPGGRGSRARLRKQLEYYTLAGARVESGPLKDEPAHGAVATSVLQLSSRMLERRGLVDRVALELDRADLALRPHEWLIIRVGVTLATVAGAVLLAHSLLVGLVTGVALGWMSTHAFVRFRANRRLKAFEAGLPDTLQLVASSLQTGFSLEQAFDAAAHDGREPIAGELSRALAETRLGAVLEDALDRVGDRMDSQDFRWTVMAIRIQRQVGGNLAEVLKTTVTTMRERAAMRRQVRALSAEGRLSAYILIALPISLFLWMFISRRAYISLLWTDRIGMVMSGSVVLLMVVGWFWMRKVIRVEV